MAVKPKKTGKHHVEAGQRTRLAAMVALALSLVSTIVAGWLAWAISTNVSALQQAHVVRDLDARFDSIAAAEAVGRLDVLSMVLTFLGIIAAIGVIYGWSAFRAAAVAAAIQELEDRLPIELRDFMGRDGHVLLGKALVDDELIARLQERFTSLGIADTETAGTVDDDAGWQEG